MYIEVHPAVEGFLKSLDSTTRAKAVRLISLLEKVGYSLRMPYSKPLSKGLFELRIRGVVEVRIVYTFSGTNIYLLHAIVKKGQRIPRADLVLAQRRRLDRV